jgi:hypothetical protein
MTAPNEQHQLPPRLERERKTAEAMIRIYCDAHHLADQDEEGLCPACRVLEDYADSRLRACRYGKEKPTCNLCPTHCYKKDRREEVRKVMRYAGPRMIRFHPILALVHLWDKRRKGPE